MPSPDVVSGLPRTACFRGFVAVSAVDSYVAGTRGSGTSTDHRHGPAVGVQSAGRTSRSCRRRGVSNRCPPSALSHPSVGRYQPLRDCRVVPDGKSSTAADLKTSGEITHLLFPVIRGVPRWMPPNSLLSRSFAARRVRASRADPQSETSGHRRCFVPRGIRWQAWFGDTRGGPGWPCPPVSSLNRPHDEPTGSSRNSFRLSVAQGTEFLLSPGLQNWSSRTYSIRYWYVND